MSNQHVQSGPKCLHPEKQRQSINYQREQLKIFSDDLEEHKILHKMTLQALICWAISW